MKQIFIKSGVSSKEEIAKLINKENIRLLKGVKKINIIEELNAIPKKNIIEYFEIENRNKLDKCIIKHREELEKYGLRILKGNEYKEFKERYKEKIGPITIKYGSCIFEGDGVKHESFMLGNSKTTLFSEEALLYIALVLEKNKIAEQIRETLYKNIDKEGESYYIQEQKEILKAISNSIIEGDSKREEELKNKLIDIQKEQIESLKNLVKESISIAELKEFLEQKRQAI